LGFSAALVDALVLRGDIVVHDREPTVRFVADVLGAAKPHSSVVLLVEKALLDCAEVEEVFADTEGLKSAIDDLGMQRPASLSA
jgi:hypothetical protein